MAGKFAGAFFCLIFAVPFGGVGVFASWAIGSTLMEAHRAQEWVRVKAAVDKASLQTSSGGRGGTTQQAEGAYRYTFQGKEFVGSRLGISALGGADNIGDWQEEVSARLEDARASGRPLSVWVNPDNPSESVFDREVRWGLVLFLVPFALAFGGVGVGALVAMVLMLRSPKAEESTGEASHGQRKKGKAAAATGANAGQAGPGFLWVFAFFWNAVSFPIAILVLPEIIENGEWAGLLVLLFPLIGVLVLWSAIYATWSALRERFWARNAGAPRPPSRSAPGKMAAQATRAMFDPHAGGSGRSVSSREYVQIPPSLAEVTESGGNLRIRYARGRNLGPAVTLFIIGGILEAIGVVIFLSEGLGVAVVMLFLIGVLLDLWAVSLIVGRLEILASANELAVDQAGLFKRQSWKVPQQQVESLRPRLTHTINGVPYFALFAHLRAGEPVPVGNGMKGVDIADAVARRVGTALALDPSAIRDADPDPTNFKPSEDS